MKHGVKRNMESLLAGDRKRCAPCQMRALTQIRQRAGSVHHDARIKLASILSRANVAEDLWADAINGLRRHARVVLHFHPDRMTMSGQSVALGLLSDGVYRSQFETGISNGSPTAFPGGDRDEWERELFDGAYHIREVQNSERPKYGAFEVFQYADGPSPRFGSCYFVLKQSVSARSSFTYGDSHTKPGTVGTIDAMDDIMTALLRDVETDGAALGMTGLNVTGVLKYLSDLHVHREDEPARRPVGRVLDDYIEAQVHGPIELGVDVERLVADPSFIRTETGTHLQQICDRYGIELRWHRGFILPVDQVPAEFRGPTMIPLARQIAEITGTKRFDAQTIGVAASSAYQNPELWSEWGSYTEVLRRFRQMWHVVVRYGRACRERGNDSDLVVNAKKGTQMQGKAMPLRTDHERKGELT